VLVLVVVYYIVTEIQRRPERHIKQDRGKRQEQDDIGQYPIYINKDIVLPEISRYMHTQTIGSTGSGKTRFVFYPWIYQDIKNGAGVFIYDIKNAMRENVEKFVVDGKRDMDYHIFCLGDENSMTYNPLAGDDAGEIANRVYTALYYDMQGGEQYYMDIAKRFLSSAISVLKKKWKTLTFTDLYIATSNPKLYLQPMCNQMQDDINARYLLDFIKGSDIDKKLLGLLNKLAQFATPDWAKQINTTEPDIDVAKIISENKVLLFQANSGIYQQEYKPLSILMMMHMQSEIARRYQNKPDRPFFIYLDEFYNIIYPYFPELINKAREAKVGLIFGHQALGDLETYGQNIKNIILSNSRNKIVLNIEDPVSAEYFSKAFGTRTIEKKINSFSTKEGEKHSGFTLREEEEFLIHPNDLKFLKLGEGVIKIETKAGRLIEKINFLDVKPQGGRKLFVHKDVKHGKLTNFKITESKDKPAKSLKDKFGLKDILKNAPSNISDTLAESLNNEDEK
jgi:type IV secretory pathway TraG/TraD family ATPase VirD4